MAWRLGVYNISMKIIWCLIMMQIHFDSILSLWHRINGFGHFLRIFFGQIAIVEFCLEIWLWFSTFWTKLSEKLSKANISTFFQLSTKFSISVEDFLKLSAIWRNYRQNYWYKKWQNYTKNCYWKHELSYTPRPTNRAKRRI